MNCTNERKKILRLRNTLLKKKVIYRQIKEIIIL